MPLENAVLADLGKQRQECTMTELAPMVTAALWAAEQLEEWTRPEKPPVQPFRSSWDATVYPVPKGVALIISCVRVVPTAVRCRLMLASLAPAAVRGTTRISSRSSRSSVHWQPGAPRC